ncbi:MAG: hypothetical protein ACOZBL_03580 [Patescibacteria group bacterium]
MIIPFHMSDIIAYLSNIWSSNTLRKKIIFTLILIAVYRLLVFIPVPFANIAVIMEKTSFAASSGLAYFAMLLG